MNELIIVKVLLASTTLKEELYTLTKKKVYVKIKVSLIYTFEYKIRKENSFFFYFFGKLQSNSTFLKYRIKNAVMHVLELKNRCKSLRTNFHKT